jgi:hypothetical protein
MGGDARGEGKVEALRVDFDGQIRLEFHGANVPSDAGLLAYRELDEAVGLTTDVDELSIHDPRTAQNTQHNVTAMMRQSVYSRLAGYEDTNDASRFMNSPRPLPPLIHARLVDRNAGCAFNPRRVRRCELRCRSGLRTKNARC